MILSIVADSRPLAGAVPEDLSSEEDDSDHGPPDPHDDDDFGLGGGAGPGPSRAQTGLMCAVADEVDIHNMWQEGDGEQDVRFFKRKVEVVLRELLADERLEGQ